MSQAARDQNNVPTLLGVSNADGVTPTTVYADPITHRLLVDLPGGTGDVVGPGSSTDNAVARFDGTTGKLLKNSGVLVDNSNNVTGVAAFTASGAIRSNTSLILEETGAGTDIITVHAPSSIAASWDLQLPADDGNNGEFLQTNGSGVTSWASATASLTVGSTTIASGTDTRILYDNAGTLGEYTISGTGTVVAMAASPVFTGPTLGTPVSGTLTNCTGYTVANLSGLGTGVATALGVNVGSAGAFVTFNGAGGTPASMVGTNITGTAAGLTAGTASAVAVGGITGLGSNVATWLATPSSANLASAVTGETGSGALVFGTSPTLDGTPILAAATNLKFTVPSSDVTGTGITTNEFNSGYTSTAIGDLVYLDSSATWQKADADASAATYSSLLGIALSVTASGAAATVLLQGFVYAASPFPTFTIGAPIYMSATAGAVTQTAPVTTDSATRIVGYGVHADKMWFNPSNDWITHT